MLGKAFLTNFQWKCGYLSKLSCRAICIELHKLFETTHFIFTLIIIGFLKLDNNPLMCNSSWCWVRQAWHNWIYLNWPAGMVCVGPADLKYFTWEAITEQNLNCSNVPGECKAMTFISIKSHSDLVSEIGKVKYRFTLL